MGVEFDSEDSREEYFRRIEADFAAVEYGAALRHAESVDLGFFGSEDDLFDDCSRIMLAEEADKLRSASAVFSDLPPFQLIYQEIKRKGRL